MKRIVWLFIDRKTHLLIVIMNFWSKKNVIIWLDRHKMEKLYSFTFQICYWDSNIWYNTRWKIHMKNLYLKTLTIW
jgi:hypothetical protein